MSKASVLINLLRTGTQTASAYTGVSVSTINVAATAGAISGMHLAGYDLVDTNILGDGSSSLDGLTNQLLGEGSALDQALNTVDQLIGADPSQSLAAILIDASKELLPESFFVSDGSVINELRQELDASQGGSVKNFYAGLDAPLIGDAEVVLADGFTPQEDHSSLRNDAGDSVSLEASHSESSSFASKTSAAPSSSLGDSTSIASSIQKDLTSGSQSKGAQKSVSQSQLENSKDVNAESTHAGSIAHTNSGGGGGGGGAAIVEPVGVLIRSSGPGGSMEGTSYADTLLGSNSGHDILIGGSGNDVYGVYSDSTQLVENYSGGIDTAYVGVNNYFVPNGIEQIIALPNNAYTSLANSSDPFVTGIESGWKINGSTDTQILIGSTGSDVLDGGGGSDLLVGGAGNDVYIYSGKETILEQASQGRDIVVANKSYALSANVEVALAKSGAGDINLTGNNLGNTLIGNDGSNILTGGAGQDTFVGNGGEDIFSGGGGADTFVLNGDDSFMGEITDFKSGVDTIALSYTGPSVTLSMAAVDAGFGGHSGEVLIVSSGFQVDWNGDKSFDTAMVVNEAPHLSDLSVVSSASVPHI